MNESIDVEDGTEADAIIQKLQTCTSLPNDVTAFKGINQTATNEGVLIAPLVETMSTEEKLINYSKPWRQVIRRRVANGRNDNESQN